MQDRWFRVTESAASSSLRALQGWTGIHRPIPSATRRPAVQEGEGLTPQARGFAPLPRDRFALSRMKGVATARPASARHDPATKTRRIARYLNLEQPPRFRNLCVQLFQIHPTTFPAMVLVFSTRAQRAVGPDNPALGGATDVAKICGCDQQSWRFYRWAFCMHRKVGGHWRNAVAKSANTSCGV